jgi:S1-C subfamily serine protease
MLEKYRHMRSLTKNIFCLNLVILTVACLVIGNSHAADYANFHTDDELNNIEIFKTASPSVVYVTTLTRYRQRFSLNQREIQNGTGTGFIWDNSGLIVTNFHVIEGRNSRISITLNDQSSYDAEIIGVAPDKDLALLRIDAPIPKLQPLPLGDSSLLEVGRKVIAIGNPFGLDTTLTVGVVSALGREIESLTKRKIRDVIQTDASINPGNSGGPLLNSLGELVGVNTQIVSPSGASAGIGFAIPVNTVKKVIPQLLEYGREVRPEPGFSMVPDNYSRSWGIEGVAVLEVQADSAASNAGLQGLTQDRYGRVKLGDVIIQADDERIQTNDDLLSLIENHKAGDVIRITTLRERELFEYTINLAEPASY